MGPRCPQCCVTVGTQEAAWMPLSQPGPGGMNLGKGSCTVLCLPAHPIPGLSWTPQLSSAASQPQLHPQDLAEGFEHLHPTPDAWGSSVDLQGTQGGGGHLSSRDMRVGVLQPSTLSQHPPGCPLLSPPCSPELAIAVWAVNLNHPILLNYFPNDMISLVHINDQFHVLFLVLF